MGKVVMQSLGEFGKHLAMRPHGREVQQALDGVLRDLAPDSVLVVNFDGVEMMDYSFADEALGTLYSRMSAKEYPDRYLILSSSGDELSEALIENVEVALQQRDIAALLLPKRVFQALSRSDRSAKIDRKSLTWRVIGTLPQHLVETLNTVMTKEEVTVRELADALQLDSATACNNRIARLHQLRLVRRKATIVPEGGRQYSYSSVV